MIWNRERYIAHSLFEDTGREMFCELFGPLKQLEEEWRRQGASAKEIAMTAFDWDYVLRTNLAANCMADTGIQPVVLEDTPEYTLSLDQFGCKTKLCKQSATIPLPMEYPIKDAEDWEKVRHWYTFSPQRLDMERLRQQKELRDKGYLTVLEIPGGFDEPRVLMGEEELCIACYEEPELLEDILGTITETCLQVIQRVGEIVPIDCVFVHEDMAGKSGPLFGPAQVRQFMLPYYQKVRECAKNYGAKLFSLDSDGNVNPILDDLLEAGINCMHPFEPAAGMDIVQVRHKYGSRLCVKGGIDKFALRKDKEAIRVELERKMVPEMLGGGTIFGIDHRIPNGVTIENYRYYVQLGRQMLGLEPIQGEGWARMAF